MDLDHLSTCPMNPASRGRHALPEEWAIEDYLEETIFPDRLCSLTAPINPHTDKGMCSGVGLVRFRIELT
ncbi:hypothetical protein CDAR_271241 [Caerostris darwini]|uniref:Uncharacterized protein n=1 Tax=Caerostris darwini TaxID=1538125 RepID=A0AAV4TEM9_9ARAC|nr:hypothetical protein CDAR_271241 [Caerostris darwini]